MKSNKINPRQIARELFLEGKSYRQIGMTISKDESTVRYWARKEKWPKPADTAAQTAAIVDKIHRVAGRDSISDSDRLSLKKVAGKRQRIERRSIGENVQPGNVDNVETIKKERADYAPIPPGVDFIDPWHKLGDAILRYCAELLMKTAHMSPASLSLLTDIGLKMTMKNPPEEKKDTSSIDTINERIAKLSQEMRPKEISDFERGEIPKPVEIDSE